MPFGRPNIYTDPLSVRIGSTFFFSGLYRRVGDTSHTVGRPQMTHRRSVIPDSCVSVCSVPTHTHVICVVVPYIALCSVSPVPACRSLSVFRSTILARWRRGNHQGGPQDLVPGFRPCPSPAPVESFWFDEPVRMFVIHRAWGEEGRTTRAIFRKIPP